MNSKSIILKYLKELYINEEKAFLAYNTLVRNVNDEEVIRFFSAVAKDEKKHMDIVSSLIQKCFE